MTFVFGVPPIQASRKGALAAEADVSSASSPASRTGDDHSTARHLKDVMDGNSMIRRDLVDRVKREIADGKYEDTDKIDKTIDELLDDILPEE